MANLTVIKDLCNNKGISIRALSLKIGISHVGLYKIIRTNSTKVETLEKIAEALNVPIILFFDNTNNSVKIINQMRNEIVTLHKIIVNKTNIINSLANEIIQDNQNLLSFYREHGSIKTDKTNPTPPKKYSGVTGVGVMPTP